MGQPEDRIPREEASGEGYKMKERLLHAAKIMLYLFLVLARWAQCAYINGNNYRGSRLSQKQEAARRASEARWQSEIRKAREEWTRPEPRWQPSG